jgi:mannose-6-phosphate isomerase-like protein (cupin superfamily)
VASYQCVSIEPAATAGGRGLVVATDKSVILLPGEGRTVSLLGHWVTFVHGRPEGAYSLIEWVAMPGVPGPPLHIHEATDEAFYVLEGTFGFQVGERTVDGTAGAFFFVPKGLVHTYWNQGPEPARMLITMSPAGFERYFEELAEGLASADGSAESALSVREALSERYDIKIVGPPRQATG